MTYRYAHFQRGLVLEDFGFHGGPAPGEPMPNFDLEALDGGRIRKADFVGKQPLLMIFASYT